MSISETTPPTTGSSDLILDSLEVKNFRAFRHLTIEKLGRVNLITGKNNVGKSSLLEALWLYAHGGYPVWFRFLLQIRDEFDVRNYNPSRFDSFSDFQRSLDEYNFLDSVRFLFHGRQRLSEVVDPITIGSVHGKDTVRLFLEWLAEQDGPADVSNSEANQHSYSFNSEVKTNNERLFVSLSIGDSFHAPYQLGKVMFGEPQFRLVPKALASNFLTFRGGNNKEIGELWDGVASSVAEDDVVEALRIIIPDIERINLIANPLSENERIAVARIANSTSRIPLRSFGDGVNKMFLIALALANSRDGMLMLDEVENGFHYSVLPDVWRFIFQTARRLNVQVFATTHSWDCIEAFQQAAAEDEADGALIRLQNENRDVTATVFDERRLAVVTREGIEVR